MTTAVPSPDLQRIVEALKACREDLAVQYFGDGPDAYLVTSQAHGQVFRGTVEDCSAYLDARCAEAMVRAIREPGEAVIASLDSNIESEWPTLEVWGEAIDAILGEPRP